MVGLDKVRHKRLLDGIHEFALEFVANETYHKNLPANSKIVHDPLWGTIKLHAWEVALLDLPLFQRLRQIHQTSLVYYVFPGCCHTRFEHTLGVIQQTQRLIDAINSPAPAEQHRYEPTTIRSLRLAALFHDCGHSCFSHISEEMYGTCPEMQELYADDAFPKCNPHEAFSSLILQSEPVRDYIAKLEAHYNIELDIDRAAKWITGLTADEGQKKHFEMQVINGPFDADKLDYIFRDAHYSGIPVGLDLDRLWSSCSVNNAQNGDRLLTLHQASVAPLEQILFSKISLFSVVYQHPKVRAAERMFHSVIEAMKKSGGDTFKISGRCLDLNCATDFLWLTDEGFFAEALRRGKDDPIHKRIHDIRYRRFPVRALTISNDTIKEDCNEGYVQLRKLNQKGIETYLAKRTIAEEIVAKANLLGEIDPLDVWVDLPSDPSFGEADRTFVRTAAGGLRKVSDLFPIHYWSELYQKYKWRGHVFCPAEFQQQIHEAALEVFAGEKYGVLFKLSAGETSHVPQPKEST